MTAMALEFLSQTHWIARALWAFSVVSGTMAVFYARALQCIMARLLCCSQVRVWIRGYPDTIKNRKREKDIAELLSKARCSGPLSKDEIVKVGDKGGCFKFYCPAITSVIAMSVPSMLLASSLISLLLGFGVYLGFLWRRDLDTAGGFNNSRDVFIFYVVGVVLCFTVYLFPLVARNDQHGHRGQSYPCLKDHPMYCHLKGKKGPDEEMSVCLQGIEQRPSCSKGWKFHG